MGFRIKWAARVVLCGLLLQPVQAAAFWPFGGEGIDYAIRLEVEDAEMQAWLKELKLDQPAEVNPPLTKGDLPQTADTLAANVKKALAAKGYLDAYTDARIAPEKDPPQITVHAQLHTRYRLKDVVLEWEQDALNAPALTTLKSREGGFIDMRAIETDAVMLAEGIGKEACLLSLAVTPKLLITSGTDQATLRFLVTHGPRANFGHTVIAGNENVKDDVVSRAVAWKKGTCFEASKLETTRNTLIQSQLFGSVEVEPAPPVDAAGEVPIHVTVKERVARTIGLGLEYSTDMGMGGHASWEHRNLWGNAQKLTANLTIAELKQELESTLRVPGFLQDNQTAVLAVSLTSADTDAYQATIFEGSATLERKLNNRLTGGLGLGYTFSTTEDIANGQSNYALLSVPGFLEYDSRDNTLDAKRGVFVRGAATPYTETLGDGGQFVKLLGTAQSYLSAPEWKYKPTFATRASLGSILGGSGDAVPPDIRFYSGGGGSVRGYSYQALSPYFAGQPVGGASMFELSNELRLRMTEEIGGVIFLDAGNSYASETPEFSDIYYGAGVGVRYYSPIGPLRADIAFPLNGSDINQTGYQFYISVGQAF